MKKALGLWLILFSIIIGGIFFFFLDKNKIDESGAAVKNTANVTEVAVKKTSIKTYEAHKAEAEYQYAGIAVVLFALAYFLPQYMMPLIALGCLNLSRVGITLYSLGEKEESSKLINQALYGAQINMQRRMEENYRLLQKEKPKATALSEAEIRVRLERIKEVLMLFTGNNIKVYCFTYKSM